MLILMRFGIKLDEIDFFEITGRGYLRSIERRIDRWKDLSPRLAARVHLSLFSQSLLRRENIRNLFTDITPRPYLFLAIRIHTAKQRRSLERSWYSLCATVDRQVVDKSLHKKKIKDLVKSLVFARIPYRRSIIFINGFESCANPIVQT